MKLYNKFALLLPALMLGGCDLVVLNPAGDVAAQQGNLVIASTLLMLIIIIPVMALTALFAWRYRAGNKDARYEPDWDHSTHLELVIWAVPLLIIICLGAMTWVGTHLLDPYRPLNRISAGQTIDDTVKPLEVEVAALDWKWLFIYPEYGVATVNELAAPVDRPIRFRLTSSSVMNSFYVPALAGQIYAMPGMETTLHGVINKPGEYEGFSATYSGDGFSHMRFTFHGQTPSDFDAWVASVKQGGGNLDRNGYLELAKPSEKEAVRRYAAVEQNLFRLIRDRCAEPGRMCMDEMMAIDAAGGLGIAGIDLLQQVEEGRPVSVSAIFGNQSAMVASICTVEEANAAAATRWSATLTPLVDPTPLTGAGLPRPLNISFPAPEFDASLRQRQISGT